MNDLQESSILFLRILLAGGLGGLLGLERDIHGRGAGLRTHLLVSVGAAVFMILSIRVEFFDVPVLPEFTRITDPGRIAAQIVTGIGFLGAGVIIKEGFTIRGLTTAACLWVTAGIGMASGVGFYLIAVGTAMVALFSLTLLRKLEKLYPKDTYRDLLLSVPNEFDFRRITETVTAKDVVIMNSSMERDYESNTTRYKLSLRIVYRGNSDEVTPLIIEKLEKSDIPLKTLTLFKP